MKIDSIRVNNGGYIKIYHKKTPDKNSLHPRINLQNNNLILELDTFTSYWKYTISVVY